MKRISSSRRCTRTWEWQRDGFSRRRAPGCSVASLCLLMAKTESVWCAAENKGAVARLDDELVIVGDRVVCAKPNAPTARVEKRDSCRSFFLAYTQPGWFVSGWLRFSGSHSRAINALMFQSVVVRHFTKYTLIKAKCTNAKLLAKDRELTASSWQEYSIHHVKLG